MRQWFYIWLGLLLPLCALAQEKQQWEMNFDRDCWLGNRATSEALAVEFPTNTEFSALSAYLLVPQLSPELSYRVKFEDGWSEWLPLQSDHHSDTPDRSVFKAEPLFTPFDQIQFRSSDSLEEPVVFRLFFGGAEKKSPDQALIEGSADSCSCPTPSFCDRNCWCPDSSCTPNYLPAPTTVSHLIVHHSAGFGSSNNFAAVVAYYWDLHVNTNGWDDIGYNWLIDPNGVIYQGRGSQVVGAHFSCLNGNTTGICLIGNFENSNPTVLAKQALKSLLASEACLNQILVADSSIHPPSQLLLRHVSGHRDANSASVGCPKGTLCPGSWLYNQLPQLVSEVAAMNCLQPLSRPELATQAIKLYPQPFTSLLQLSWPNPRRRNLKLFTAQGKLIRQLTSEAAQLEWPLADLPAGSYLLQWQQGQSLYHHNLIKK